MRCIVSFEQGHESRLLEVLVSGQSVRDAFPLHDDERNAVGQLSTAKSFQFRIPECSRLHELWAAEASSGFGDTATPPVRSLNDSHMTS